MWIKHVKHLFTSICDNLSGGLILGDAEAGEDDTGVVIMARGKRFGNSACDEDAVDGF